MRRYDRRELVAATAATALTAAIAPAWGRPLARARLGPGQLPRRRRLGRAGPDGGDLLVAPAAPTGRAPARA